MFRSICSSIARTTVNQSMVPLATTRYVRFLYTAEALGIDKYLFTKEKVNAQFLNSADKFKSKMREYVAEGSENLVFTEDLKNMAHLVEKSPEDIELITKMMVKFNSQNKELRFGSFVFGPVIMRMLYKMGDEEAALRLFNDSRLEGFFDQMMSYQILLDLLYEKKRYQDVRATYDTIRSRQAEGGRYHKQCLVLVFGACYKENTPESFEFSSKLWQELSTAGHVPMRKAATFAAGLALNQNAPHVALEIISCMAQQNYVTVRNLKIKALTALNRPEDILPILRSILEVAPTGITRQQTVAPDVLDAARESIAKNDNKDLQSDFTRIEKFLRDHDHVGQATLDEILSKQVDNKIQTSSAGRDRQSFNQRGGPGGGSNYENRRRQYNATQRPGLRDLY